MLFARNNRKKRKLSPSASTGYVSLEARNMLTLLPPPGMTADVQEFAASVDNAIVRVDDQQRLIIRTTGEQNRVDVRLEWGYLQVNRSNYFSLALEIDPSQYDSIVMLSGGDDDFRVSGSDITAQLRPDRLWVSAESHPIGEDAAPIQIFGSDFNHLEVNDSGTRDYGPYIHDSTNRVRMYGAAGVDRLDMSSDNSFAIRTSATLTGDGYFYSVNTFADLYVNGAGGNDSASIVGTRGFDPDSPFVEGARVNGKDVLIARDDWTRVRNDLWDARVVDFETQRIDLLSGEDRSIVEDTDRTTSYYRVDGSDLVGAFRRFVGVENIEVVGNSESTETFRQPQSDDGVFSQEDGVMVWSNSDPVTTEPADPSFPAQLLPDYFEWKFATFDRVV